MTERIVSPAWGEPKSIEVIAVNRFEGVVLLNTGEIAPICKLFDLDGEETDDRDLAVAAVVEVSAGWLSVDLTQFGKVSVH